MKGYCLSGGYSCDARRPSSSRPKNCCRRRLFSRPSFCPPIASALPLLAAIGAKTNRIEIGTAVIDMRYESPLYMVEDAGAADLIAGGLHFGIRRGSPNRLYARAEADDVHLRRQRAAGLILGILGSRCSCSDCRGIPVSGRALS